MPPRQRVLIAALAILAIALVAAVLVKTKIAAGKSKVTLVAYYPFNASHKPSVDMVMKVAAKYPGKVTAEAYDFTTPEGRDKWFTSGLSCAGVLINGTTEWNVIRSGKPEKLSFQKREGILWTESDLNEVVKQLVEDPKKPIVLTGEAPKPQPAPSEGQAAPKPKPPGAVKDAMSDMRKPEAEKPAAAEAKPAPSKAK